MTGLTLDDRGDMGAEVNISPKNDYFYTDLKNDIHFSRKNAEGTALAKFIHTSNQVHQSKYQVRQ